MTSASAFWRRTAAVVLLVGLLAAVGTAVALPIVELRQETLERQAELTHQLEIVQAALEQRPRLEQKLKRLKVARPGRELFLPGRSDAGAGAAFQEHIKAIVSKADGKLESLELHASTVESGFHRLGLRARFTGSIEALRTTLRAVEFEQPLVLVDSIDVRSKGSSQRQDPHEEVTLSVSVDLAAFWLD